MAIEDLIEALGLGPKPEGQEVPDSNVPYQLRSDYEEEQDSQIPMPKSPGKYSLPGFSAEELSSLPYQQRPDYQASLQTPETFQRTSDLVKKSLVPGESAGIPSTPVKSKSSMVRELAQVFGLPQAGASERAPAAMPSELPSGGTYVNPLDAQTEDLNRALADRQKRMNLARISGGATDIVAAGNRMLGLKDDRRGYGDAASQRMEDIELKDFNERLGLAGKVSEREKARLGTDRMGSLNDPNSEVTQMYRDAAVKLGFPPEVLGKLTGAQIQETLGQDVGALMNNLETRKLREQELKDRQINNQLDRELKREQILKTRGERLDPNAKLSPEEKLRLGDELKENTQIKKENRKERTQLEKDIQKTKELKMMIQDAKEEFETYSKGSITGTGPVATLGGLTSYVNDDTERLKARFNKLGLDSMVKMFAGMSKAVDTGAERAAFESTQPRINNDDSVNTMILNDQLAAAERMLQKQQEAIQRYDRTGAFTEEETRSPQGQGTPSKPKQIKQNGHIYTLNESTGKYE